MKALSKIFYVLVLLSLLTLSSCDEEGNLNLFTLEDDVQLGAEVNAEIRSNPVEYPIYTANPTVKSYIQTRIFEHVLQSSEVMHDDVFPYQFEIIDEDSILNAFALPGGYIYLYTGLLQYLDSEAALAGIIGHEIAHAEKRHTTQRLTAYYGVSLLLSIVLGENPTEIEEIAANLFVGLTFLANSRSDESEADRSSFEYLMDTRYYTGGVKFFFEKLRDEGIISSQSNSIETFLSTHPDPIDRIDDINTLLQENSIPVKSWQSNDQDIYRQEYFTNIRNKL